MKPLRYTTSSEEHAYMRLRKEQNRARLPWLNAEKWFLENHLAAVPFKFSRQAIWGYRLFDFWFHDKGIVIEVDGPEHNEGYDAYRDKYNFLRSGIVVLRVRNFNEEDAKEAIRNLGQECGWRERREALGLLAPTKRARRELAVSEDWQEALRRVADAGLFCSYGKPTDPPTQAALFI